MPRSSRPKKQPVLTAVIKPDPIECERTEQIKKSWCKRRQMTAISIDTSVFIIPIEVQVLMSRMQNQLDYYTHLLGQCDQEDLTLFESDEHIFM